jgi:hypothetical protein
MSERGRRDREGQNGRSPTRYPGSPGSRRARALPEQDEGRLSPARRAPAPSSPGQSGARRSPGRRRSSAEDVRSPQQRSPSRRGETLESPGVQRSPSRRGEFGSLQQHGSRLSPSRHPGSSSRPIPLESPIYGPISPASPARNGSRGDGSQRKTNGSFHSNGSAHNKKLLSVNSFNDLVMGDHASDSQDSHEEWIRCWNCDGPVRRHWDECPALGCGVELPPETRAEAPPSYQPRKSPGQRTKKPLRDWSAQAEERTTERHINAPSMDADEYVHDHRVSPYRSREDGRKGDRNDKLLLAPAHSESDISYASAADDTLDSPSRIPGINRNFLPRSSESMQHDDHDPGNDAQRVQQRLEPLARTESFDSVWDQKDALPTTKELPKPKSLQRRGRDRQGEDESDEADVGSGWKRGEMDEPGPKRAVEYKGGESDDDYGMEGGKNDFETDELGNAGGEALGAVKLPDWMQVSVKDMNAKAGVANKQGKPKAEGDGPEWRVHFNNNNANQEEDRRIKDAKGGQRVANAVETAKYTPVTFLPMNLYMQFSR